MAVIQVELINGATADANDVMDNFDEIYDNIDSSNVASANKTGTGKFLLQTSPVFAGTITGTYTLGGTPTITGSTVTSPAISNPTITGTATFNSGADLKIYSDVATTLKFQVDGATGAFGTTSGQKLFLDGASLAGDTSIYESAANVISFQVGGSNRLDLSTTSATFDSSMDVKIAATKGLYLDGGGDTYLTEVAANTIRAITGGTSALTMSTTAVSLADSRDLIVQPTQKLYLDGGADTYLAESSANTMAFVVGGSSEISLTTSALTLTNNDFICGSGNISVATNSKVLFDGSSGNAYINNTHPGVSDILHVFTDGVEQLTIGGSFPLVVNGHLVLDLATKDLEIQDAGTAASTEVGWIQVDVQGTAGFIRVYATK